MISLVQIILIYLSCHFFLSALKNKTAAKWLLFVLFASLFVTINMLKAGANPAGMSVLFIALSIVSFICALKDDNSPNWIIFAVFIALSALMFILKDAEKTPPVTSRPAYSNIPSAQEQKYQTAQKEKALNLTKAYLSRFGNNHIGCHIYVDISVTPTLVIEFPEKIEDRSEADTALFVLSKKEENFDPHQLVEPLKNFLSLLPETDQDVIVQAVQPTIVQGVRRKRKEDRYLAYAFYDVWEDRIYTGFGKFK